MPISRDDFVKADDNQQLAGGGYRKSGELIEGIVKVKNEVREYGQYAQRKFFVVLSIAGPNKTVGEQKLMFHETHYRSFNAGDKIEVEHMPGEWGKVYKYHAVRVLEAQVVDTRPKPFSFNSEYVTGMKLDNNSELFRWAPHPPLRTDPEIEWVKIPEIVLHLYLYPELDGESEDYCDLDVTYHTRGSFSGWKARGIKSGKRITLTEIESIETITLLKKYRVPLSEIFYLDGSIRIDTDEFSMSVTDLPFESAYVLDNLKAEFEGEVEVTGMFYQNGKWDPVAQKVEHWWEPKPGSVKAKFFGDVEQIKRAYADYAQMEEYLEMLRELQDAGIWPLSHALEIHRRAGVEVDEEDLLSRFWQRHFSREFYDYLRDLAGQENVWMTNDYFIFRINNRVVIERPEYGAATYIFGDRDVSELLAEFNSTPKLDIIRSEELQAELKFKGRAIHDDMDMWKYSVKNFCGLGW